MQWEVMGPDRHRTNRVLLARRQGEASNWVQWEEMGPDRHRTNRVMLARRRKACNLIEDARRSLA